eukprot:Colp12_sorted_trinity150504_noHs@24861
MAQLPEISVLNTVGKEEFVKAVNTLFETAPPLAKYLYDNRPYDSYESIISAADKMISAASDSEKVEILNAHPVIGERKQLSALSRLEQGLHKEAAGVEDPQITAVYEELEKLNKLYFDKFGFKFIIFVNGRSKADLLPEFRARLEGKREDEMRTGLEAMVSIARDRLYKLQRPASKI